MTPRRQQMERNLPEESKLFCQYLYQNLVQADIGLPDQDIRLIGKIFTSFIKDTAAGKRTALHLLRADLKPASVLKTYFKAGRDHSDENRIRSSDLQVYEGIIYKGVAGIPLNQVDVVEKEETRVCDSCGGWFPVDYCTRSVEVLKQTGQSRIEIRCNHCRAYSEDPKIRETGSLGTCGACEKLECEFHPRYVERTSRPVVALLPAAGEGRIPAHVSIPPGWSR